MSILFLLSLSPPILVVVLHLSTCIISQKSSIRHTSPPSIFNIYGESLYFLREDLSPTMIQLPRTFILVPVLILGLLFGSCHSLQFDLQSGHTKCISEDIKINAMTVGKYHVVNPHDGAPLPDTHKITVRVTSPLGNSYHVAERVESGQFAFTSMESGDYMTCIWTEDHKPPVTLTVDFDWKTGVSAKNWNTVAKKGSVDAMEMELKKLMDSVSSIHDEMFYLRDKEQEMQELNKSTNSKMFWFGFTSLFVCLSVAGLQFWHLKHFFERKKLL